MRAIWEGIKEFFERDWTPAEKILVIVCCLLLGIPSVSGEEGDCLREQQRQHL